MNKYRRIIRYALRQWRKLLLIGILSCASAGLAALTPLPMKVLVDVALGDQPTPPAIRHALALVLHIPETPATLVVIAALLSLLMFLISAAVDAGLAMGWTAAGQRMVYDLAAELFARLQRLSLLFHGKTPVGDSLSRLSGDTWCVYTVSESVLVAPIQNLLTLTLIGVVAWQLDWKLACVAFAMAPLLAASAWFFGNRLKIRTRINRDAQARLASFVHTTLGAIPLAQAFEAESRNVVEYRKLADAATRTHANALVFKQIYTVVNAAATILGTAVVLFIGGQRVLSGAMTLGSLLVFLAYLKTIQNSTQAILGVYGSIKSVEASIDRVNEVLDVELDVREEPHAKPVDRGQGPGASITWESISFGYETNQPILHNLDLAIQPGQMLAVVGPTGAGKSTLVSLIPRFFDPWKGRLLINGQDIRYAKLADVRAMVSIVLQEPFLLPLSIAQNIAYGRPDASRQEIEHAAITANADSFIRALPQGYDTVIGERGATLSGGERQRISIARAILKNAPILILDEPTASLDAQTEASVMEALHRLMTGRTCVVIAHRLSTVRRANLIAVLEKGRIVETGGHDELMSRDGLYRKLNELQFGKATPQGVLA